MLDKRVNTELGRIRKDVDERLGNFKETFREEINDELSGLNDKLNSLSVPDLTSDRSLNVVIRGLPETDNENLNNKVNAVLRDGLQIRNVQIKSVERKPSNSSSKPGVVITSFKSKKDKRKVMTAKSNLKDSRQYRDVYLHQDQSREQRLMTSNFKAVLDALNRNDRDLSLHGTRVVRRNQQERQNRQDHQRDESPRGRDSSQSDSHRPYDRSNYDSNRGRGRGNNNSGNRGGNGRGQTRGGRGSRRSRGRSSY